VTLAVNSFWVEDRIVRSSSVEESTRAAAVARASMVGPFRYHIPNLDAQSFDRSCSFVFGQSPIHATGILIIDDEGICCYVVLRLFDKVRTRNVIFYFLLSCLPSSTFFVV
jgi:hypothetical protein